MTDFMIEIDDIEHEMTVKNPNAKDKRDGEILRASTFSEFVQKGALLKPALDIYMRDQGLWDDDKSESVEKLGQTIRENDRKLKKGGIRKSEGRKIAIDLYKARSELLELMIKYNELNGNTAEAKADDCKFDFLVSRCIVYKTTGKPLFSTLEDYQDQADTVRGNTAATEFAKAFHGHDPNYDANLPENKFLKRFGYINDEYQLINEDGELVDMDGNLLETEEKYDDIQEQPFLDDDDQPIEE